MFLGVQETEAAEHGRVSEEERAEAQEEDEVDDADADLPQLSAIGSVVEGVAP